ncbi:hypothetical protein [Nocardiopsis rhodophaea]|uniref:hypothetical protein n=1 Tax=Nocardiopsis rhodophaea TaxID=280238 RepID=UPI0039F12EAF
MPVAGREILSTQPPGAPSGRWSGRRRITRSNEFELVVTARCAVSRAAGRAANAIRSSSRRSTSVRRANRSVSPPTCSANVLRGQSVTGQRNLLTSRLITVRRLAIARSTSRRR